MVVPGRAGRSFVDGKDEETTVRVEERGRRHERKRWQFIRVPGIVDTYYHAKYNMLTTSHNTAILSIPPGTADRRIASLRARRASKILLPNSADAAMHDALNTNRRRAEVQ